MRTCTLPSMHTHRVCAQTAPRDLGTYCAPHSKPQTQPVWDPTSSSPQAPCQVTVLPEASLAPQWLSVPATGHLSVLQPPAPLRTAPPYADAWAPVPEHTQQGLQRGTPHSEACTTLAWGCTGSSPLPAPLVAYVPPPTNAHLNCGHHTVHVGPGGPCVPHGIWRVQAAEAP